MKLEDETKVVFSGNWETTEAHVLQNAFLGALSMEFKIPNDIRYMDGMSGRKYRALINNLIETTEDVRYLEIGTCAGSTACSAIYGNKCSITCIDDWSWEYQGIDHNKLFKENINRYLTDDVKLNVITSDFRKVDYSNIGKFNVYMYDGPHAEKDQYDGLIIVQDALDDVYTLIVDDWNNRDVRIGTENALKKLEESGQKVIARLDIFSNPYDGYPDILKQYSDWHNGYVLMVISKK